LGVDVESFGVLVGGCFAALFSSEVDGESEVDFGFAVSVPVEAMVDVELLDRFVELPDVEIPRSETVVHLLQEHCLRVGYVRRNIWGGRRIV